jgi:hypothetical protein
MEPKKLLLEDGTEIKARICGRCNRIWPTEFDAEKCCTCSYCQKYCDWKQGVAHRACQDDAYHKHDQEQMDRAVLVPDYDGPFLVNDSVYMNASELLDWEGDDDLPEFGFCTRYTAPVIRLDNLMENIASEMHDDWEELEVPELAAAIEKWNEANKENGSYFEDRKRKWSKEDILRSATKD